uniref:Apoptosis, caspase activation inhibitor n=1 Tax=Cyprinus carpio TaxID=7962 RepID=A0A8C1V8F0_CYPCA
RCESWDSFTQFRFSDEKDWEMDSLEACSHDLPALTQSLQELPLHTRLNLEAELVQVDQLLLKYLPAPVKNVTDLTLTARLKAPQTDVKPVPGTTPSRSVSTAVPPATDDADQELDLLLDLQKPITEMTSVESHATTDDVLNSPTKGRYMF